MAGVSAITPLASAPGINKAPSMTEEQEPPRMTLKKALILGMIRDEGPLTDKFKIARDAGFDGVELNSPVDLRTSEVLEAKSKSGMCCAVVDLNTGSTP